MVQTTTLKLLASAETKVLQQVHSNSIGYELPKYSFFSAVENKSPIQTLKSPFIGSNLFKDRMLGIHVSNLPSSTYPERKAPSDKKNYRFSNRHTLPKQSAICVQRFDDSRDFAIHITYRISLRSSSLREPRDPLSKVVSH